MGEIIRQEKKQKRKEMDKVCTLHSDFVTAQRTEADSGVFGEKMILIIVVILIQILYYYFSLLLQK